MRFRLVILAICGLFSLSVLNTHAARPTTEAMKKWGDAELVFVGKLDSVQVGPTALSSPPIYNHTLSFSIDGPMRGTMPMGGQFKGNHSARQKVRPVFPEGKKVLVAAKSGRGGNQVLIVEEVNDKNVAEAQAVCSVPVGWRMDGKKLVSPWATLPRAKWSGGAMGDIICDVSGRPGLLAGRDIELTVEHVPPPKDIKWTNPDGDGEYKVTVSNPTDIEQVVPALLRRGKEVLWKESVAIVCQEKVYAVPGATGSPGECEAVKLKPGESVSTVVNVFQLQGPEWPRGGYRIAFQFCLGEKSATKSFYYLSRHHDKVREKVLAALKKE